MNLLDVAVLAVLAISVIIGVYNGFGLSVLHVGSFIVSWLLSFLFYPAVSRLLLKIFPDLLDKLIYYTDGASSIVMVQDRAIAVSTMTPEAITDFVAKAGFPSPFDRVLEWNMKHQALGSLQTTGEYFDFTVANVVINIASILLLFLFLKLLFSIAISVYKGTSKVPVLKQFDGVMGGVFGFARGLVALFLIFAVAPVLLAITQVDKLNEYVEASKLAGFFINNNIFAGIVRGFF
jgi:uncharacterized membrane protein required for colicin V production